MNDNYKPEIMVVRRSPGSSNIWMQDIEAYPQEPRALLVQGVPMEGQKVISIYGSKGKVVGYDVRAKVDYGGAGEAMSYNPTDLSPVPDEAEAMVERVVDAITRACLDRGSLYDIARVAVRAMEEGS